VKKIKRFRKKVALGILSLLTVSNMAFGAGFARAESNSGATDQLEKLDQTKRTQLLTSKDYKDGDIVRVIVQLEGDPAITLPTKKGVRYKDLPETTKNALQTEVKEEQSDFLSEVSKKKINFKVQNQFTTVVNGVSGNVEYGKIDELEKLPNVESVSIVNEYERPKEKPQMISSKNMVEAIQTWNAGYNGKGMVVGIIDTGIDSTHPDMKLTDTSKEKLSQSKVNALIKSASLKGKFYTDKVPYGYNYADKNAEIRDLGPDASMHGMHVAGTVGANGDESKNGIKGIAPEAQLLALKVFGNDPAMPSTFGDIYIKAIDDGIILGADVMNMSLGSPAGFVDSNSLEQQAIDRAVNNGVLMSISAGNNAQQGDGSTTNPYATNPDIGMVGDPGLSTNSIAVASIENDKITLDQMTIKIGNETLPIAYKTQESPNPVEVFGKTAEKDLVYVGDGSKAQYTGKNVKGKVVFVVRTATNPNYSEIQKEAEAQGAASVIIRGHASHGDYVSMALSSPTIPLVSISQSDGNTIEAKLKAASGTGKVTFTGQKTTVANSAAGTMSTFSSWGVTPELDLKPEITAPGGQIYSTLNDGKYGVMSGTSMAAPHVSGGSALVLQRVHELFPDLKGIDLVKRAKTMLMNTAKVVPNPANNNIPYSPRLQGAGLMQLYSAVTTPVYVVNKGTNDAKVELKEIDKDKFTMTVTATNFSDKDVTYNVNASALTDAVTGSRLALKDQVISNAKVTVDSPKVNILAGRSVDITVQIDLTNAKADLEKAMPNGYFVEGFITLTSDDQNNPLPNISVPYVGFKGDWSKPPILDNMIYDANSYMGYSGMVDDQGYYLGYNPFTKKYNKNLIAISPNGDGENEAIAPVLDFLRNSKIVEYAITDKDGKTLRKLRTDNYQRKNYVAAKTPYSYKPYYTEWDGYLNNKVAADGTYIYQIKTQVDLPGKPQQVVKIPVIVDNTAPVVSSPAYSKSTGILSFDANDGTGSGLQYIDISIDGKVLGSLNPGTSNSFKVNIGQVADGSSIEITAYDYAYNHAGLAVSSPGDNTIPFIVSDSPVSALEGYVYSTREVPLTGYVTDGSKVDYLKVKGDKIAGSPLSINLVYNPITKQYDFGTQLKFTDDGVHDVYFEGADVVGNKIEFRRQVIVDTIAPTLNVSGIPENNYVAADGANPELTITVADNFDDVRLLVNGSEEYHHDFDEPFEKRAFSYDYKFTPELNEGKNELKFVVEDLAGHKVNKTITIYKGEKPAAPYLTSLSVNPGENISQDNPAVITAEASDSVMWEGKVIDPSGNVIELPAVEGKTYEGTYTPDALAENGLYTLVLSSGNGGFTQETTFKVLNFPVSIESITTADSKGATATSFTKDSSVSIKADLKNLSKAATNPTVIVQISDQTGLVVYYNEVTGKPLNNSSKTRFNVDIPLENFKKGTYKIEVFVWDNIDNPVPLSESSKTGSFKVN